MAHVIHDKLIPALGAIPLQQLKALDIKRYYVEQTTLSISTVAQHHAILTGALQAAAAGVAGDAQCRGIGDWEAAGPARP